MAGARFRGAFAAGAAVAALAAACSLALDFNGIDDGTRDAASADTSAPADAFLNPPPSDAAADVAPILEASPDTGIADASDADAASDAPATDGPCQGPGPTMVQIGTFCIDSTEVTVDQYSAFLLAKAGDVSGQPPLCAWNGSFVPAGGVPTGAGSLPIANVNWCQAFMYCAWAGKHLCGSPDGGTGDPNRWGDAVDSEWFHACSRNNDGLHNYPYGNAYIPTICNGSDYDPDAQARPALTSCEGGYPGIVDMSGNLWEWEDRCLPATADAGLTGAGDFCFTRGGAFSETAGNLTCGVGIAYTRESQTNNVGFRCCSP
jgi:sulfatase modifying factor 1